VTVVDWVFRDRRTGRIVIAQWPNLALGVWLGATVLRALLDPTGAWRTALDVVGTAALTWWAVDEIVRGVNPSRRFLGALVLTATVLSLLR
jgi:hypothetical protein